MNTDLLRPPIFGTRLVRIQKLASVIRIFFFAGAILMGIATAAVVIAPVTAICAVGWDKVAVGGLMLPRLGLTVLWCLTDSMGLWSAYKLFRLYSHGSLFTAENIGWIKRIAYVYFLLGLENGCYDLWLSPPGAKRPDNVSSSIIVAGLILFIAWIMDEGRKMHEEQELTV